jgi:hypothetical protein
MKRRSPQNGGPSPVAVQSNQDDSTRPLGTQNDAPGIGTAWHVAIDALEPAWHTVAHLVQTLQPVLECGSPADRDLAIAAIDDVAQRRRFSPRRLAELLRCVRGDDQVPLINDGSYSSERTIVARPAGSDDRVLP